MKKERVMILVTILISLWMINAVQGETKVGGIKLKGDIRLRYQSETKILNGDRVRNRIRVRLGGQSDISEKSKVKIGIATGSDDSRSTNQTFENSFQSPDIRLDYAYIESKLTKDWSVLGGKMKNPLWRPSDLLWDSDINPDGVGVRYKSERWFINGGYFLLDEISNSPNDPGLIAVQKGINLKSGSKTKVKAAVGYYISQHVKDQILHRSSETNHLGSTGGLEREFSSLVLSGQVTVQDQFGVQVIKPFGEVVLNTNRDTDHRGYILGLAFGDEKVKSLGAWQSKVSYRYLQKDTWLDIFPDSDAYGGSTNIQGLELIVKYGLSKSITLGLDIYSMDIISGNTNKQDLVQVDLNIKF